MVTPYLQKELLRSMQTVDFVLNSNITHTTVTEEFITQENIRVLMMGIRCIESYTVEYFDRIFQPEVRSRFKANATMDLLGGCVEPEPLPAGSDALQGMYEWYTNIRASVRDLHNQGSAMVLYGTELNSQTKPSYELVKVILDVQEAFKTLKNNFTEHNWLDPKRAPAVIRLNTGYLKSLSSAQDMEGTLDEALLFFHPVEFYAVQYMLPGSIHLCSPECGGESLNFTQWAKDAEQVKEKYWSMWDRAAPVLYERLEGGIRSLGF